MYNIPSSILSVTVAIIRANLKTRGLKDDNWMAASNSQLSLVINIVSAYSYCVYRTVVLLQMVPIHYTDWHI